MVDSHKEDKTMMKRLTMYAAAALLALALPAHAADRTYSLCDPAKAKMCASLVALYEFDEASNSDRTSETGTAPFLEPSALDISRDTSVYVVATTTHGSVVLNDNTLYIPRSPSLGTSFTANLWMRFSATPGNNQHILYTLDGNSSQKGSRLYLSVSGSNITPRFEIKQSMTDTVTYVAASTTFTSGSWHLVSFGIYASPTTTEPYQSTLWISLDGGAKATATAAYPPQVFLGDFILNSGGQLNTYFDQFSIFSGTLSAGEVSWLYNSGAGRAYPFTANP